MEWIITVNSLCDVGYLKVYLILKTTRRLLWAQRDPIIRNWACYAGWGLAMVLSQRWRSHEHCAEIFCVWYKDFQLYLSIIKIRSWKLYRTSYLWKLWETQTISEFTTSWPWLHWIRNQVPKFGKNASKFVNLQSLRLDSSGPSNFFSIWKQLRIDWFWWNQEMLALKQFVQFSTMMNVRCIMAMCLNFYYL